MDNDTNWLQKVYATYGIGIYFTDTIRYDLSHGSTNRFRTPIFFDGAQNFCSSFGS
nr:MAG TPA: hypothetical protein [Caudoviricetes sp.]